MIYRQKLLLFFVCINLNITPVIAAGEDEVQRLVKMSSIIDQTTTSINGLTYDDSQTHAKESEAPKIRALLIDIENMKLHTSWNSSHFRRIDSSIDSVRNSLDFDDQAWVPDLDDLKEGIMDLKKSIPGRIGEIRAQIQSQKAAALAQEEARAQQQLQKQQENQAKIASLNASISELKHSNTETVKKVTEENAALKEQLARQNAQMEQMMQMMAQLQSQINNPGPQFQGD